ncbi:MAG TPA: ABC transporter permease [Ilumatobacter sp.]|nr:ABC transporter permease [Ilumatobacter sp.]
MSASHAGRRPWGTYVLYVVTALGMVYLFIPLLTIARFTFNQPSSNYNTSWNEFTTDNWRNAFEASDYRDAFVESIKVAIIACGLATILGALVAIALTRYKMRGGAWINFLLVLPLTTPEIVLGASTFTLFFNQGVRFGFWTIVAAHTMFCLSFVALTVKARIRGLDWSLEDAAADLGSPPLRTFAKVTLPLVTPGIAAAFMLSVSLSIDDYIITSFVAGQVSTFPREIWDSYIREVVPQIQVFTTIIMLVVISVLVVSTLAGKRRRAQGL